MKMDPKYFVIVQTKPSKCCVATGNKKCLCQKVQVPITIICSQPQPHLFALSHLSQSENPAVSVDMTS